MAIYTEKFQQIADAIKSVNDRSSECKIIGNDFASEISKLDPRLTPYYENFENGFYGLRAVKCAATYLLARVLDTDKFAYRQDNIFSTSLRVRDGQYGRIDCSALIGLCLRGIPYEKSPYAAHTASNATWTPSSELNSMYGIDGWEFKELDKQKDGLFNNIGISGFSSIRTAADLGQYFYKHGLVIYDSKTDGALSNIDNLDLQAGDLVFWSKTTSQDVLKRFKSISHVAMVSENITFYYDVTGSENSNGDSENVINYTQFGADSNHPIGSIVLICRPDYRPRMPKEETPIGVNLLTYPWTYARNKIDTISGTTFTVKGISTLNISGTNTAAITRNLKGYPNSDDAITLSPGTYQVSGMTGTGIKNVGFAIQIKHLDNTDFSTAIRCYDGNSPTFTITEETKVIARLNIGANSGSGYTLNCDITPTLMRIS